MKRDPKYSQMIYDQDLGIERTYLDYAEDYGFKFADMEIEKLNGGDAKSCNYKDSSKEKISFWNPDKKTNSGQKNVVNFKPKKNTHKQYPIDDQFLALEYERFYGNEMLMKTLANKTMLFLVLLKDKVDWDKNEKLNLFQDYFVKRKLIASSISRVKLARILGVHKRTITNWLGQLENDGLIKIERISC